MVVFWAQLAGGAGTGAWSIGLSGAIAFCICALPYSRRTDPEITRADWIFLVASLSVLLTWFLTSDAMWAVVILTAVDLAGFAPTFRAACPQPLREQTTFFALGAARNVLVILALEHYSVTTVLFPFAGGVACIALVALISHRRRRLRG